VEVVRGVFALLEGRLRGRDLAVSIMMSDPLPGELIDKGLLRQLLLAVAGYLVERAHAATLVLAGESRAGELCLRLTIEPSDAVSETAGTETEERLAAFDEIAALSRASLWPIERGGTVVGFDLRLPISAPRTVLAVDDNEDILELFRRYLTPHGYRVAPAHSVPEAVALATRLQPYAITVDLMLPGQDGWDLLQILLNRAETRHIPIYVCSVLKQKELALSLGATGFIEKPVSEEQLLAALAALERS
jgi:CheY-like chemotaxis protein